MSWIYSWKSPNSAVKNALAAFNPVYMEAAGGFNR